MILILFIELFVRLLFIFCWLPVMANKDEFIYIITNVSSKKKQKMQNDQDINSYFILK